MKAKSSLKVVAAQEHGVNVLDMLHEARAKHAFMTAAIVNLWGNKDSIYGDRYVFGCQLLMHDIEDQLEEIHKALDKDAPSIQ